MKKENKQKRRKYNKKYYQEHKEELKEHQREYNKEHEEERKEYDKKRNQGVRKIDGLNRLEEWRKNNPLKTKQATVRWTKNNPTRIKKTSREYYLKHKKNNFCINCGRQICNTSEICAFCSRIGKYTLEKNPNWQGGLSFEPYDKSFNNKFKRAIRKRDNQICLKCGVHREKLKETLTVHHVDYNKKLSIPQNCCSLCRKCNTEVNYKREHWQKFFQSLLAERYGYQYSETGEIVLELNNKIMGV